MNLEKSQIKMQLAQTWGKKLEAIEESARNETLKLEGAVGALNQAAEALHQHKGKYQHCTDEGTTTVEECTEQIRVVDDAIEILEALRDTAQVRLVQKRGQAEGVSRSLDVLERAFSEERSKLEILSAAVEEGGEPDFNGSDSAADIERRRQEARSARTNDEASDVAAAR